MIKPQTIEQIKNRIDIIDVIGEYVKLKKRGANYLGNCPFHNEKSPSFTVSPSKELYKCFGCGKSGNTITFLMEHDKLSYVEALRWLAGRYGIEVEETESTPEQKLQQQTTDSLYIINNFAQKFFEEQLFDNEEGQAVGLSYLRERGFTEATVRKFQLGYNPRSGNPLTKALLQNQFNKELLPRTGLVAVRANDELVDNYRERIIFPIHSPNGKILGFGARVIGKVDKAPKYINTPENEIYVKSKILYGAYFARQAIDKADECLLVEGYTDVVSLHQAGVENVVASGGTSLTTDQLRLIKKYTDNLTIIYDGDSAGIKAALRGMDMALEEGLNVKLVLIPDNEDPDSYVHKVGTTAFKEFVAANKKDFILFQLDITLKDAGNDIAKKNDIVNRIAESLSKIDKTEDFTKLQEYIKQCAAILKIDEVGLNNLVNKYKRDKITKDEKKSGTSVINNDAPPPPMPEDVLDSGTLLMSKGEIYERNILKVLMDYGLKPWDEHRSMAQYIFDELEQFQFDEPELERLYNRYKELFYAGAEPTSKTFLYDDDSRIRELVVSITVSQHELSQNWDTILVGMNIVNRDVSREDVMLSVNYYKLHKVKMMIEQNQNDMLNPANDFVKLIAMHNDLKEYERTLTNVLGSVIVK